MGGCNKLTGVIPSRPSRAAEAAEPADTEPGPAPSLPADSGLWRDSDVALPLATQKPASKAAPGAKDGELPTIGHIGRYALKYQIGEGGLGTVYAAHDPLLSRLIAIKTLNVEISAEEREAFNKLFLNEARAAGSLSHPNIVTVFDAGVSDDKAYIAMELLKGRDLRQLRKEGWRATPAQAALIVRRVADALAYAHSKGVVHRDIKPANIFMVGRTQPRVLDFGIARVAHAGGDTDIAAGSPYYMSPEQARQQPVDRRCDVFSLGVVLYELLTDQRPFRGASLADITQAVLEHQPPPAHTIDPAVPPALADIAARAMEKDPEHRYRSARALSRELRHWLEENQGSTDTNPVPSDTPDKPARRGWAVAAALAVVAIAGVLWASLARLPATAQTAGEPAAAVVAAPAKAVESAVEPRRAAAPAPAATPALPVDAAVVVVAEAAAAEARASTAAPARPARPAAKPAPAESTKDKRAREARERETRPPATAATTATAPLAGATGTVRLAVSPWGTVEVDGASAGTAPPLTELTLTEGRHQITIRNADFPPQTLSVTVVPGTPTTLKHKFGS